MALATADGRTARHSSETAEHYTPEFIVEAARKTLGAIDLDPASTREANEVVQATTYFGLDCKPCAWARDSQWIGRVFLNPPGGGCDTNWMPCRRVQGRGWERIDGCPPVGKVRSSAKTWWQKLAHEWFSGHVPEAIFVGFSLEILQVTQVEPRPQVLPLQFPMCFPTRRVAYRKPDGTIGKQPPHASVLVYLGRNVQRFQSTFGDIGHCVLPMTQAYRP